MELTVKHDKIRTSIEEILRIVICIFHIAFLIYIILIGFFLWICYKQKLSLRRTDAQGQPARASLRYRSEISLITSLQTLIKPQDVTSLTRNKISGPRSILTTRCLTKDWISRCKATKIIPVPSMMCKVVDCTVLVACIVWLPFMPIWKRIFSGGKRPPVSFFTNIRVINPIQNWMFKHTSHKSA